MNLTNLFAKTPDQLPTELVEVIVNSESVRIERIISTGHCSPPHFWYDQSEVEWVVVLQGEAILRLEGNEDDVVMRTGDAIKIPAHQKHRVEWTSPHEPTIWLAVFFSDDSATSEKDSMSNG